MVALSFAEARVGFMIMQVKEETVFCELAFGDRFFLPLERD